MAISFALSAVRDECAEVGPHRRGAGTCPLEPRSNLAVSRQTVSEPCCSPIRHSHGLSFAYIVEQTARLIIWRQHSFRNVPNHASRCEITNQPIDNKPAAAARRDPFRLVPRRVDELAVPTATAQNWRDLGSANPSIQCLLTPATSPCWNRSSVPVSCFIAAQTKRNSKEKPIASRPAARFPKSESITPHSYGMAGRPSSARSRSTSSAKETAAQDRASTPKCPVALQLPPERSHHSTVQFGVKG